MQYSTWTEYRTEYIKFGKNVFIKKKLLLAITVQPSLKFD